MTKQVIKDKIKARIVILIRRKKETLDAFKDADWEQQGILAERNMNYEMENKFLNELLK